VALVSGKAHELPVFAELLEGFVRTVGRGRIIKLLLDARFWTASGSVTGSGPGS